MNENEITKRLKDLMLQWPQLKSILLKAFPEFLDESPFIKEWSIFIDKDKEHSLYLIQFQKSNHVFNITNLSARKYGIFSHKSWKTNSKPTGYDESNNAYLSKKDFIEMLPKGRYWVVINEFAVPDIHKLLILRRTPNLSINLKDKNSGIS